MAYVIAFLNTKGGVAKSTNAINLAEAYRLDGARVLLIDYDFHQATTNRWKYNADMAGKETCRVIVAENDLVRLVGDFQDVYDVILIDAPGRLERATTSLIAVADLVLMPVQPSALDLWTCEKAVEWVFDRRTITGGTPDARFLMTRCNADERVNQEDIRRVEATGIPPLKSRTVQRVAYPRLLASGQTVFDLPETDKARCEMLEIFQELKGIQHDGVQS